MTLVPNPHPPRRGPAPNPPRRDEHTEQKYLIDWTRLNARRLPALTRLYAIPNGGGRGKAQAGMLRAEGVRKGVLDLCLPVARGGWHGLYIEMKAAGGRVSPEQQSEILLLAHDGYLGMVAYGMAAAIDIIEWYLAKPRTEIHGQRAVPPWPSIGIPKR